MPTQPITCYRCHGRMAEGFVVDHSHSARLPAQWHPDAPVPSFWLRTKVDSARMKPMAAYRCENCGLVELYAK